MLTLKAGAAVGTFAACGHYEGTLLEQDTPLQVVLDRLEAWAAIQCQECDVIPGWPTPPERRR